MSVNAVPGTKEMVDQLRTWRKDHPKTDLALSFVPGVGTALAFDDFGQDPTVLGAAGLAISPLAKARQIKTLGIKSYHASPHKIDKVDPSKIGTGQGDSFGGPGFYSFPEAKAAIKYLRDWWKDKYIYELDIPDETITKRMRGRVKTYDTRPSTEQALKDAEELRKKGLRTVQQKMRSLYGEKTPQELVTFTPEDVKILRKWKVPHESINNASMSQTERETLKSLAHPGVPDLDRKLYEKYMKYYSGLLRKGSEEIDSDPVGWLAKYGEEIK